MTGLISLQEIGREVPAEHFTEGRVAGNAFARLPPGPSFEILPPVYLWPHRPDLRAPARVDLPALLLCSLRNALLVGGNGLVTLQTGQIVRESLGFAHELEIEESLRLMQPHTGAPAIAAEPAVVAVSFGFRNYYHLLVDVAPWLDWAPLFFPPGAPRRFITRRNADGQWVPLWLFGIRGEDLIAFDGSVMACAQVFFVGNRSYGADPVKFAFLRRVLGAWLSSAPPWRRIFVDRSGCDHRRIANQAELLPVLARHGFAVVRPETLTVPEQVRLFSETALLICPHGAAYGNVAFMAPGTAALELTHFDLTGGEFQRMAAAAGLRYGCLFGDALRQPLPLPQPGLAWDFVIPPQRLDEAIVALSR